LAVVDLSGPAYSWSLIRGLAILGYFTPERPALLLSEISEELEMSKLTTRRYATTRRSRKYRPGPDGFGHAGARSGQRAIDADGS
jgi:hypothetical protein